MKTMWSYGHLCWDNIQACDGRTDGHASTVCPAVSRQKAKLFDIVQVCTDIVGEATVLCSSVTHYTVRACRSITRHNAMIVHVFDNAPLPFIALCSSSLGSRSFGTSRGNSRTVRGGTIRRTKDLLCELQVLFALEQARNEILMTQRASFIRPTAYYQTCRVISSVCVCIG